MKSAYEWVLWKMLRPCIVPVLGVLEPVVMAILNGIGKVFDGIRWLTGAAPASIDDDIGASGCSDADELSRDIEGSPSSGTSE